GGGTVGSVAGTETTAGRRRRVRRVASATASGSGRWQDSVDQRVWTNGEHDLYLLPCDGGAERELVQCADRATDIEHDGVCAGRRTANRAGRCERRTLHRWRRVSARLLAQTGADG